MNDDKYREASQYAFDMNYPPGVDQFNDPAGNPYKKKKRKKNKKLKGGQFNKKGQTIA